MNTHKNAKQFGCRSFPDQTSWILPINDIAKIKALRVLIGAIRWTLELIGIYVEI